MDNIKTQRGISFFPLKIDTQYFKISEYLQNAFKTNRIVNMIYRILKQNIDFQLSGYLGKRYNLIFKLF